MKYRAGAEKEVLHPLLTRRDPLASGGDVWEDSIYRNFNIFPYTGTKLRPELSIFFARSANWAPDHVISGAEWNSVDGDKREKKIHEWFFGEVVQILFFFTVI